MVNVENLHTRSVMTIKLNHNRIVLILSILLIGCASVIDTPEITVRNAWVRATSTQSSQKEHSDHGDQGDEAGNDREPGGIDLTAGYLTILNHGQEADRLLGVECDIAEVVELHSSVTENGIVRMVQQDAIEVPAGGEVELKPGGLHIMLIGLTIEVEPGDKVLLRLLFESQKQIEVQAEVRNP